MIIFRYLFREIYYYLLAITSILLIVFITNQFEHYLHKAAMGDISMITVLKVMLFQIPLLVAYLLPLGFYLAILLAFGRLYMDSEMTVLSACGVSRGKMLSIVMIFATILAIFVAWLMLWVEPILEDYQGKLVQQALASATVNKIIPMQFHNLGKEGVIYAQHVSRSSHRLENVFFALGKTDKKGTTTWDITQAKKSYEVKKPDGEHYFVFDDGHRYVGSPGQLNYQAMSFSQYGLHIATHLAPLSHWPNNVPTMELIKLAKTNLRASGTLQWRLAMPLMVFILGLMAFPLSRVNPRLGKFAKLAPALLIYIVYADLIFMGREWIFQGAIPKAWGLWWLHGIFLMLAILLNLYFVGFSRIFHWFRRSPHYASS